MEKSISAPRTSLPEEPVSACADHLGESLVKLGLPIARFKTGTPPRVNVSSINFTGLERQDNDDETAPFSLWSEPSLFETRPCYINTY